MAKGAIAKDKVARQIINAFGEKYIGEYNKKYYVLADDGGEEVQIAISLTYSKTPIAIDDVEDQKVQEAWDWDDTPAAAPVKPAAAQISEEEQQAVLDLMERLGL